MPNPAFRIGIDLGGTKIEAIALSASGSILARRRVATPKGDYELIVKAIVDLVSAIEKELGGSGTVGLGTPGTISPATGLIKNANSTVLIGHALDKDLSYALDLRSAFLTMLTALLCRRQLMVQGLEPRLSSALSSGPAPEGELRFQVRS